MNTAIYRTEDPTLETVEFEAVYRIRAPRTGEPRSLYKVSGDCGVNSAEPLDAPDGWDDAYEYPRGYARTRPRLTRLAMDAYLAHAILEVAVRPAVPLRLASLTRPPHSPTGPAPAMGVGPRHAPEGPRVVGCHAVAELATADIWRRSNERWGRKPLCGASGGVSEKPLDLYIHVHLHLLLYLLLLSILSSIEVTTVATVGTLRPYGAKKSVARSVAKSPNVATTPGLAPTPLGGAVVDRRPSRC